MSVNLHGGTVEILVAELKQEDEASEDQFIFQGVVSPVFIFLGKNGKFFNVLQGANLSFD